MNVFDKSKIRFLRKDKAMAAFFVCCVVTIAILVPAT